MNLLQSDINQRLILNTETNFRTDLGWEEGMQEFEKDTLKSLINPAEHFETVRYIHKPYVGLKGILQSDIWLKFYFFNNQYPPNHDGGLNYEYVGLTPEKNARILRSDNNSFFRLEFYKTPNNESPNSGNTKLVFTKNLPIPLGEKVFYTPIKDYIYVPVFMGSNYRNKENMFLYWFQDDTVLSGTILSGSTTGSTFYMSAKFYNTIDGTTISFLNKSKDRDDRIYDEDIYRRVDLYWDYSYVIYTGITTDHRAGESSINTPMKFYSGQISNSTLYPPTPPPTPSITPTPTITPTQTVTPTLTPSTSPVVTPTPTPTVTPSTPPYYYRLVRCIDNVDTYYATHPSSYLNIATGVWGSIECDSNYAYRVIGSTQTESDYSGLGYTNIGQVSISTHQACYDCTDNPITPPPSPPAMTMITLLRKNGGASETCFLTPPSVDTIDTGYIQGTVTPHSLYTVYNESNMMTTFTPEGLYWGIILPGNPSVQHTVYIGANGALQDWTDCVVPSVTPSPSKTPSVTPSNTPPPSVSPSVTPSPVISFTVSKNVMFYAGNGDTCTGESGTFNLTSSGDWHVTKPTWVSVIPSNGNSGNYDDISVTVASNSGIPRDGVINFFIGTEQQNPELTIYQEATGDSC